MRSFIAILIVLALVALSVENTESASTITFTSPTSSTVQRGTTVPVSIHIASTEQVVAYGMGPSPMSNCVDTIVGFDIDFTCQWEVPNKPNASYTLNAFLTTISGATATASVQVTSGGGKRSR